MLGLGDFTTKPLASLPHGWLLQFSIPFWGLPSVEETFTPQLLKTRGTRSVSAGLLQGTSGTLEGAGTAPTLFSTDLGSLKLMPSSHRVRSWSQGGNWGHEGSWYLFFLLLRQSDYACFWSSETLPSHFPASTAGFSSSLAKFHASPHFHVSSSRKPSLIHLRCAYVPAHVSTLTAAVSGRADKMAPHLL